MKELVFGSSVQKEFAEERRAIADYVRGDALLRKHFEVFLFEDVTYLESKQRVVFRI